MKKAISIVLALSVSLFIYLFYRSERTVVNELFMLLLSLETYLDIKAGVANTITLNDHIIFSLPGGLWVFCVTVLSNDFYFRIGAHKIQVTLVPMVFALLLEFCQLVHITNGTFDVWDVGFLMTFWGIAYYAFPSQQPRKNILAPLTLPGFICLACFLSVYLAHVSQ